MMPLAFLRYHLHSVPFFATSVSARPFALSTVSARLFPPSIFKWTPFSAVNFWTHAFFRCQPFQRAFFRMYRRIIIYIFIDFITIAGNQDNCGWEYLLRMNVLHTKWLKRRIYGQTQIFKIFIILILTI